MIAPVAGGAGKGESRIPVEDRLFSLVLALLATETGLLKSEILSTVRGYAERSIPAARTPTSSGSSSATKTTSASSASRSRPSSRPIGPATTRRCATASPRASTTCPTTCGSRPTSSRCSASPPRSGARHRSQQTRSARSRSSGRSASSHANRSSATRRGCGCATPRSSRCGRRSTVARRCGSATSSPGSGSRGVRTVIPLAVVLHEGRWHLHALRPRRDEPRTFLLSRIIGDGHARCPGRRFDAPPPASKTASSPSSTSCASATSPTSPSTGGSDAEVRLGKRAIEGDEDAGVIRLHYTDAAVFADELAAYGPEVRVLVAGVAARRRARPAARRRRRASRRADARGGGDDGQAPEAAEGARQARLPALARAVPARTARRRRRRGRDALRAPEEEIRDAVRLIATSGLPGETGTYQPNDLFDIDWDAFEDDDVIVIVHHVAIDDAPRLSAREAAALIAGLQYLSASPENAGSASLASLMAQAHRRRIRSAEPPRRRRDRGRRLARAHPRGGHRWAPARVRLPQRPRRRGRRRVDPLRILSQDADWYLQAYCHTARRRAQLPRRPHERPRRLRRADRRPRRSRRCPTRCSRVRTSDLDVVVDVAPETLPLLADYLADSSAERGRRAAPGHAAARARARPQAARRRACPGS